MVRPLNLASVLGLAGLALAGHFDDRHSDDRHSDDRHSDDRHPGGRHGPKHGGFNGGSTSSSTSFATSVSTSVATSFATSSSTSLATSVSTSVSTGSSTGSSTSSPTSFATSVSTSVSTSSSTSSPTSTPTGGSTNGPISRPVTTIDRSTLTGKFMVGYQAWFRKPGEDDGNSHWTTDTPAPEVGHVGVDMLPNVTGYPADCLFDSVFTLADGSPIPLFSNDCDGVVDLHFKMMADHGIDGAFLQRFFGYIGETDGGWINILNAAMTAAEKYGRGFVIEYDLNGAAGAPNITETYLEDLASLSNLTSSPAYMHHDGKPVVEIWGFGIVAGVTVEQGIEVVTTLKNAGWYVILGVQQAWHAEMVQDDPGSFGPVYALADMLQPWTVGSYDFDGYPGFLSGRQAVEDTDALQQLGIDSSIVVWPGGSNANSNPDGTFDQPSRMNGSFYQEQLTGAVSLKPVFIFGAMFDEMNEGTAIFPLLRTSELPTNQRFLGLEDDTEPDVYLTMAGTAGAQLAAAWAQ